MLYNSQVAQFWVKTHHCTAKCAAQNLASWNSCSDRCHGTESQSAKTRRAVPKETTSGSTNPSESMLQAEFEAIMLRSTKYQEQDFRCMCKYFNSISSAPTFFYPRTSSLPFLNSLWHATPTGYLDAFCAATRSLCATWLPWPPHRDP